MRPVRGLLGFGRKVFWGVRRDGGHDCGEMNERNPCLPSRMTACAPSGMRDRERLEVYKLENRYSHPVSHSQPSLAVGEGRSDMGTCAERSAKAWREEEERCCQPSKSKNKLAEQRPLPPPMQSRGKGFSFWWTERPHPARAQRHGQSGEGIRRNNAIKGRWYTTKEHERDPNTKQTQYFPRSPSPRPMLL